MKKGVLKNFTKFIGKHLCRVCFPVNFVKILRKAHLQNTLEQIRTPPVAASVIRRKTKRVCFDKPFIWFCNFYFVIRCYLCFFWNDRTQKLLIPLPCLSYTKFCCSSMCFIHFSNTLTIWVIQCCI